MEENDNDVKLLLAHIKKMQNTAEVRTLASDGTAQSTKNTVGEKGVDVSIRKVICTTG